MDLFWTVGLYIMFFILIFANYGSFARTIVRWSKKPKVNRKTRKIKQPSLTVGETVMCYVPFVQCVCVRKALYHRAPIVTVLACISGGLIVIRLVNTFLLPINSYVMFFTSVGILVGVFVMLLLYGFITADCAKMYGYSWLFIILSFLLPMILCWWIAATVPYKMRSMYEEEVFSENRGDTVIKRKHSE